MTPKKMRRIAGALSAVSLIALAAGCARKEKTGDTAAASAEDAAAFVEKVETTYRDAFEEAGRIQWVNSTYINFDTDWLAAKNAGVACPPCCGRSVKVTPSFPRMQSG